MTVHIEEGGCASTAQENPLLQQGTNPLQNGLKSKDIVSWTKSYEELISTWTLWSVYKSRRSSEC